MSAQTSYKFSTPLGVAGGIVDLAPYAIDTFTNEEATGTMGFGVGVVDGTTAGVDVKLPASASDKFEGVTVNNLTTELDLEGKLYIRNKAAIGVMRYGKVYVKVADGITPAYGDAAYLVCTGDDKGCFTNASTGAIAINGRFVSAAANGIAMLELQQANIAE